jgi:hypothetical protein
MQPAKDAPLGSTAGLELPRSSTTVGAWARVAIDRVRHWALQAFENAPALGRAAVAALAGAVVQPFIAAVVEKGVRLPLAHPLFHTKFD